MIPVHVDSPYSGGVFYKCRNNNMFKNNILLTQKAVSATETHPALPSIATLRLRSESNGQTDRGDSLFGNLTIGHSPTKELGGGFRHVVRVNLREQGDIPPASAYLVVINRDNVAGEDRAKQAVNALFVALSSLNDDITATDVSADGIVSNFSDITDSTTAEAVADVINGPKGLLSNVGRLLGRES